MWGSPGSLLAACFLHEQSRQPRWTALFRRIAARLDAELKWSDEFGCHYWTQDLYGRRSTYLDGVHGFVATAASPMTTSPVATGWPSTTKRRSRRDVHG